MNHQAHYKNIGPIQFHRVKRVTEAGANQDTRILRKDMPSNEKNNHPNQKTGMLVGLAMIFVLFLRLLSHWTNQHKYRRGREHGYAYQADPADMALPTNAQPEKNPSLDACRKQQLSSHEEKSTQWQTFIDTLKDMRKLVGTDSIRNDADGDPDENADGNLPEKKKNGDKIDEAPTLKAITSRLKHQGTLRVWLAMVLIFFFSTGYMYWPDMFDKQGAYVIFLILETILFLFTNKILNNMNDKVTEQDRPSSSDFEVLDSIHFYQMCFLIYGIFLAVVLFVVIIGASFSSTSPLYKIAIDFQKLITGELFSLMGGSFASFMVFTQFKDMYKYYRTTQHNE